MRLLGHVLVLTLLAAIVSAANDNAAAICGLGFIGLMFSGGSILIIAVVAAALTLSLWIYALGHCASRSDLGAFERMSWIVMIIVFPILGSLIYLLFVRGRKI